MPQVSVLLLLAAWAFAIWEPSLRTTRFLALLAIASIAVGAIDASFASPPTPPLIAIVVVVAVAALLSDRFGLGSLTHHERLLSLQIGRILRDADLVEPGSPAAQAAIVDLGDLLPPGLSELDPVWGAAIRLHRRALVLASPLGETPVGMTVEGTYRTVGRAYLTEARLRRTIRHSSRLLPWAEDTALHAYFEDVRDILPNDERDEPGIVRLGRVADSTRIIDELAALSIHDLEIAHLRDSLVEALRESPRVATGDATPEQVERQATLMRTLNEEWTAQSIRLMAELAVERKLPADIQRVGNVSRATAEDGRASISSADALARADALGYGWPNGVVYLVTLTAPPGIAVDGSADRRLVWIVRYWHRPDPDQRPVSPASPTGPGDAGAPWRVSHVILDAISGEFLAMTDVD